MIRQSPLKMNATYTKRSSAREQTGEVKIKTHKRETKHSTKVLELLKAGLKRPEDKSKNKTRRL